MDWAKPVNSLCSVHLIKSSQKIEAFTAVSSFARPHGFKLIRQNRKPDRKDRSSAQLAFDRNLAMMLHDDFLSDGLISAFLFCQFVSVSHAVNAVK